MTIHHLLSTVHELFIDDLAGIVFPRFDVYSLDTLSIAVKLAEKSGIITSLTTAYVPEPRVCFRR